MTERMREALATASKQGLRRVHHDGPGAAHWPAHPSSLAALVRCGYLTRERLKSNAGNVLDVWTISELGKEALKPPKMVGTEQPVYMARGAGTTSDWTRSIDGEELEGAPSEAWLRVSLVKRVAAQDRKARARQAAEKARYAA